MSFVSKKLPLAEVAEFIRGVTFKPYDVVPIDSPGAIACMRTKNVQHELDQSDTWAIGRSLVKRPDQYLKEGDILVSSANSWNLIGKCCRIPKLDRSTTFGGFVSVLRVRGERIDSGYLYRWFSSKKIQHTARSFGRQTTNICNLDLKRCLLLDVYVPPLADQRRILTVLDHVETLRVKRRETLAQLDKLPQAIFRHMFGSSLKILANWQSKRAEDLLDFLTSGSRGWAKYYNKEGDLFIRIQNVRRDQLVLEDTVRVAAPRSAEADRTRVRPGDVLLSITADLGRTAVVPEDIGTAYINQHLSILRSNGDLAPNFLSAFLASPTGQRQISRRNRQGVKAGLNFDDIRSFEIPIPPLGLQREFTERVETIERLKTQQRVHLTELDALFESLEHRAFRGEL